jgi:hypothetical protein
METANVKLCECGKCGLPAPIAKRTDARRGHVKGQPMRFVRGHSANRSDRIADYLRLRNAAPAEAGRQAFRWSAALRWAAYCMAAFLVGGAHFGFARIAALAAKIAAVVALSSLAVSGLVAVALVACIVHAAIRRRPDPEPVPEPIAEKLADAAPGWFDEVTELQAKNPMLRRGSWEGL